MKQQKIQSTATGIAGIILVIIIALMVNWIAAKRWVRKDVTSSQMYTVSERTGNLLSDLSDPVEIIVFMTPATPLFEQVQELLSQYESLSPMISVEMIDPDREPIKTQGLAEKFGISAANTVVFSAGDRTKYVTSEQMAEYDFSGMQYGQPATMKAFKGEEQFTAAILSLVAPDIPKIYFVGGHGESSLHGDESAPGLLQLQEALKRENMEVAETILLSGQLPEDADAIVIVGPTQPYTETEISLLRSYIDGGGRVLACLDPLINSDGTMRATRLEALLSEYGVEVGNNLVVDPSRKLPYYDLSAVYLDDYGDHAITHGLDGVAVLFMVTRSIAVAEAGANGSIIVETTADGWGETDLAGLLNGTPIDKNENDLEGPVPVGAALEFGEDESIARLVVFGDSDFISDTEITNAGNLTLALNTFNWLVTRDHAMGIPPRQVEQVSLYLTGQQLATILLLVLIIMPGGVIVVGIIVWRRRRR